MTALRLHAPSNHQREVENNARISALIAKMAAGTMTDADRAEYDICSKLRSDLMMGTAAPVRLASDGDINAEISALTYKLASGNITKAEQAELDTLQSVRVNRMMPASMRRRRHR